MPLPVTPANRTRRPGVTSGSAASQARAKPAPVVHRDLDVEPPGEHLRVDPAHLLRREPLGARRRTVPAACRGRDPLRFGQLAVDRRRRRFGVGYGCGLLAARAQRHRGRGEHRRDRHAGATGVPDHGLQSVCPVSPPGTRIQRARRSASAATCSSDPATARSHGAATRSPHQLPRAHRSVPSSPAYVNAVPPSTGRSS